MVRAAAVLALLLACALSTACPAPCPPELTDALEKVRGHVLAERSRLVVRGPEQDADARLGETNVRRRGA